MRLVIAKSGKGLVLALMQAKETAEQEAARGVRLISNTYLNKIIRNLDDLVSAREAQARTGQALSQQREALNKALEALVVMIRAFWEVASRRQVSTGLNPSSLLLHQIPRPRPKSDSPRNWQIHAQNIINGEVDAQALGLPAMANPSAEDVATRLQGLNVLIQAFDTAKLENTRAQNELSNQLKAAETCLRNMGRRLRESLTDKPESVQREIMRTYGLGFKSSQTATPQPEVQTPGEEGGEVTEQAALNPARARKDRQTKREKKLQRKVERTQRQNEVLQQQLQELQDENEYLREEIQEYRDTLGSIQAEFTTIKKDLNQLAAQQATQQADSNVEESDSADTEQQQDQLAEGQQS